MLSNEKKISPFLLVFNFSFTNTRISVKKYLHICKMSELHRVQEPKDAYIKSPGTLTPGAQGLLYQEQ